MIARYTPSPITISMVAQVPKRTTPIDATIVAIEWVSNMYVHPNRQKATACMHDTRVHISTTRYEISLHVFSWTTPKPKGPSVFTVLTTRISDASYPKEN
jgi:hypothetical protein